MQSASRASVVVVLLVRAVLHPAVAQVSHTASPRRLPALPRLSDSVESTVSQEVTGIVVDADGQPLKGAVVGARIRVAYALSDRDGPVRAPQPAVRPLRGACPPARLRARTQSRGAGGSSGPRGALSITFQSAWRRPGTDPPQVLAAGVGPVDPHPRAGRSRSRTTTMPRRSGVAPASFTAKRVEGSSRARWMRIRTAPAAAGKRSSPGWAGRWRGSARLASVLLPDLALERAVQPVDVHVVRSPARPLLPRRRGSRGAWRSCRWLMAPGEGGGVAHAAAR